MTYPLTTRDEVEKQAKALLKRMKTKGWKIVMENAGHDRWWYRLENESMSIYTKYEYDTAKMTYMVACRQHTPCDSFGRHQYLSNPNRIVELALRNIEKAAIDAATFYRKVCHRLKVKPKYAAARRKHPTTR